MTSRVRLGLCTLLVALGLGASRASPALALAPSEEDKRAARARVLEGDSASRAGDHASALQHYAAAFRLVRVPTIGIELVEELEATGRLVEAHATALAVAELPRQAGEPPVLEAARQQAMAHARRLALDIPELVLVVAPGPGEPMIELEGRTPGNGERVPLDPGAHRVRVTASGYQPFEQALELATGERRRLEVVLVPSVAAPAASPPGGPADGTAAPGAGAPAAAPPLASEEAASGDAASAKVIGGPASEDPGAANAGRTRGYVALGIAGGAAVIGIAAGVMAYRKKPDCPNDVCLRSVQDDIDSSRAYGTAANVSGIVALVLGVYGAIELVNAGTSDATAAVEAGSALPLRLAAGGAAPFGFQLQGEF